MPARRRHAGSELEPFLEGDSGWTIRNQVNTHPDQNFYLEEDDCVRDLIEIEPSMSARDRTGEFANTIRSLQGRNISRAAAFNDVKKAKAIQGHSEFMLIAKNVGRNIANTYAKLEKLTLCKSTFNLFMNFYVNVYMKQRL